MTFLIEYMPYIAALLILCGTLFFVIGREQKLSPPEIEDNGDVEYRSRKTLMTRDEVEVFQYLKGLAGGQAHICPMVRISDIISVHKVKDYGARLSAFSSISQKHVDFVVITNNGRILFAIELDDDTHRQASRIKRDELVNMVFQKAGIKLLRGSKSFLIEHSGLKKYLAPRQESAQDKNTESALEPKQTNPWL